MLQPIKVISFDLDDTLWPCLPTIHHAEQTLFDWLDSNVPAITRRYTIEGLRDKRKQLMRDNPGLVHDLSELRIRSFIQLAEELDLPTDWVQPAFDVFYHARQKVRLFDDVAPVLDHLSDSYTLVSLTNGNADIYLTGVDHWFTLALNSAQVGKQKSQPDIYRRVQSEMAVQPSEMLHIGDDPVHDIAGAQSAGVKAVWLNREGRDWTEQGFEPDAVIHSLHDIHDVLAAIGKHA